jgi:hypothetical protein
LTIALDDTVMRAFLRRSKALARQMHDPKPLMDLFYDWLMVQQSVKWKYMRRAGDIVTTLITLPVPLELRREYALKLIDNYRIMSTFPPAMLELIDDSMLPHMRSLVQQSLDDPETLPLAVARYLADRGDLEVFPVLSQIETKRIGPKLLRGHKPEELSGTLSWRIKVQHPPETLLNWLAMGPSSDIYDHYIGQDARTWLMERAIELGLDKQAIREAVLTYARRYFPAGHPHNMELRTVKLRAIELGVLQPSDLPEIKLPRASRSNQ